MITLHEWLQSTDGPGVKPSDVPLMQAAWNEAVEQAAQQCESSARVAYCARTDVGDCMAQALETTARAIRRTMKTESHAIGGSHG